jgi:hypothetical protein
LIMKSKITIPIFGWFSQMLTIVFIALKLTGVINWGWMLVLSPMLVNFAILLLLFVCVIILSIITAK